MLLTALDVLGSLALIATLVAVIIYTKETAKLRKEAQKQNELALRPFIMPKAINPYSDTVLMLTNIGHSPAFNICIDTDEDAGYATSWTPTQSFLAPGENGRWDRFLINLDPDKKPKSKNIVFDIHYENIERDVFYTKVLLNFLNEEQEFIETGKVRRTATGGLMSSTIKKNLAKEYFRFLSFILLGFLTLPLLRAILPSAEYGISGVWKSLINFEFLFNTDKGPLPAWLLICFPYIAFLFIRSVLWAKKQLKPAKPPV